MTAESALQELASAPRYGRFIEELKNEDPRTPTQVDRDRVLYSTWFARLAEVTQVVSADHGYVFHNRLTHSLKVAQLTQRMAEYFNRKYSQQDLIRCGGLDVHAAETAALAHDIGHPPFGHLAEKVLDDYLRTEAKLNDGFEGNAQSFRIIAHLAVGDGVRLGKEDPIEFGLNPTRATLNAVLKYPWLFAGKPTGKHKWGAYDIDKQFFEFARADFSFDPHTKCLEAELMDWADDITYAVHDVTDFYCAGKIPLDRLLDKHGHERGEFFKGVFKRNEENPKFTERKEELKAAFDRALSEAFGGFPYRSYSGIRWERIVLWQIVTKLITRYVGAIKLNDKPYADQCTVLIDPELQLEVEMLKQLTWHYVIDNNELATLQAGQKEVVRLVLDALVKAAKKEKPWKLFPPFYEKQLYLCEDDEQVVRVAADCVSSMTEKEIVTLYNKITGRKIGPNL